MKKATCLSKSLFFMVNDEIRKTNGEQTHKIDGIDYAAFSGMEISHGLKTVPRTVFLTAFRFPYGS